MAHKTTPVPARPKRRNTTLALACFAIAAGMVGLAYASVPLYRLFCQVTGFAGTTQIATSAPAQALDQSVSVRFDANIARNLNWTFEPVERGLELKIGETRLAYYRATNRADHPVTGTATFNVTPEWTGQYFNKIECFCFTEQTLAPGESVDMLVAFFIDPAIVEDRSTSASLSITLSYTFYPVADADRPLAAAPATPAHPATGAALETLPRAQSSQDLGDGRNG